MATTHGVAGQPPAALTTAFWTAAACNWAWAWAWTAAARAASVRAATSAAACRANAWARAFSWLSDVWAASSAPPC